MKPCKKAFLFFVGVITITFDQVAQAINEAVAAVDQESQEPKKKEETSS
jgi:hypothetical protein